MYVLIDHNNNINKLHGNFKSYMLPEFNMVIKNVVSSKKYQLSYYYQLNCNSSEEHVLIVTLHFHVEFQ